MKKHLKNHANEVQQEIKSLNESTQNDFTLCEQFGIKPVMVVVYRLESEILNQNRSSMEAFTNATVKRVKKEPIVENSNKPEMLSTGVKKHSCKYCAKMFVNFKACNAHEKNQDCAFCHKCGKYFPFKSILVQHFVSCNRTPFT